MKSVKPGRGPSFMGGMASVAAGVFGIFWMIFAVSMDAPGPFVWFGVLFVVLAMAQGIYHFVNAFKGNRFSHFDITSGDDEPDPFNSYVNNRDDRNVSNRSNISEPGNFCPYCGSKADTDHLFCKKF